MRIGVGIGVNAGGGPKLPPPPAVPVTFVGAGAQVESVSAGTLEPELPQGVQEGDLLLAVAATRVNAGAGNLDPTVSQASFTFPEGWEPIPGDSLVFRHINATADFTMQVAYKVAAQDESAPTVGATVPNDDYTQGWCVQIAAYRGVDDFDAQGQVQTSGSATSFQPNPLKTLSHYAVVVAVGIINNDVVLLPGSEYTTRFGGEGYFSDSGGQWSVTMADRLKARAGSVPGPVWAPEEGGPPSYAHIAFSLKPAA